MSRRSKTGLPPLEYRPVFVQFIKRQRCRYNPSYAAFERLPATFQVEISNKWITKHPRQILPDGLSLPPIAKPRKRR